MSEPIPFPKRVFRNSAEAALFAADQFHEVLNRREQAALRCDRDLMQVVIDIYRRDIIPYNSRFEWHLSHDLLNFGQWLRDPELIEQSIALIKKTPPDTLVTPEPLASAKKNAALGKALLARCELAVSRPMLLEAISCFVASLEHSDAYSVHDVCHFEIGLALSHLLLAEIDCDDKALELGMAALKRAAPLHTRDCPSLDLARQQEGEARAQALMAKLHVHCNASAALQGVEDAIQTCRSWDPPYVVPPVWIERLEKLRANLSEVG